MVGLKVLNNVARVGNYWGAFVAMAILLSGGFPSWAGDGDRLNAMECQAIKLVAFLDVADAAGDALGGHDYPWYDAENRGVKPLTPKTGAAPLSTERATIKVTKKTKPVATNNLANSNGRGGGGLGTAAGAEGVGSVLMVVVGVAIVLVVVALVLTFLKIESEGGTSSLNSSRSRRQSIEQLPFDLDATDGDFRSVAQNAYQGGDLKTAMVYLYSHVLVTLDQSRLIRLRKGKTNRQYFEEVRGRQEVADYFWQVMLPFEAVFFGDHDMDVQQFQRCWAGLDKFHDDLKDADEVAVG